MGHENFEFAYNHESNSYLRKEENEQAISKKEKTLRGLLAVMILAGGYIGTTLKNFWKKEEKTALKIPTIEQLYSPSVPKANPVVPEIKKENIEQRVEKIQIPQESIMKENVNNDIKKFEEVINFNSPKIELDEKNCDLLTDYYYNEYKNYNKKFKEAYVRMAPWREELEKIFESYGVPKEYIFLAIVESNFENKISKKGATGHFQIIERYGKKFGLKKINNKWDERHDPLKGATAAAKMLKENFDRTKTKNNPKGDWDMAFTIYNGFNNEYTEELKDQGAGIKY